MVDSASADHSEESYAEVLAALFSARRAGIDFGLERIQNCLHALGLDGPDRPLAVQVAGTNGKGSTACFLSSILQESGVRVGVFSSPHLLSLCERFRINSEAVTRSELAAAYRAIRPHAEACTFFEQVTAMAAWLFRERKVDVAIYEVGLGGRLDSTSAIDNHIGVVTGIGLDHCEYLGSSLEEIAREKAGIFRSGSDVVIGLGAPPAIRQLLEGEATAAGAQPTMVSATHQGMVPAALRLQGEHQRENAAAAACAALALRRKGLAITDEAIALGLGKAELAGRLQEVEPGLWIDGAHNAQAAEVLAQSIGTRSDWVLVAGLSQGKPLADFLEPLRPHCELLIATEAKSERACAAAEIARVASEWPQVELEPEASAALRRARSLAGGRPILVTGSLLLLGQVLGHLGHGPADPFLVTDPGGKFAPAT
jgi:dihydrofolate synthase/folylpolyglutamate synthase